METLMTDNFHITSAIHQTANALNPPEGYDPTMDAMQHQLMREQHDFYTNQQSTQSFEGFGGLQGLKEAATGFAILIIIGLFIKFVLGWS
jgi:hypothetical protein